MSGVGARDWPETSAARPGCPCASGFKIGAVAWLAVIVSEQDVSA
ncbi:MAG TPA: hypothetical protein VGJ80_12750 [Gemmatimonadales bacterium]